MYPRTNYEMTEADFEKIIAACKPVPYMVVGGIPPRSQQENANEAWAELGRRMGFDGTTVEPHPTNPSPRFFTAVPSETEAQRNERESRQREEALRLRVATLEREVKERQDELTRILNPPPPNG